MGLQENVMSAMKEAMKAKDTTSLEALRAIKSAILLAQTEQGASGELTEDEEIKMLQKLVKQRKDSALLYQQQNRADLAEPELAQAAVIEQFLPEQLGIEEIREIVSDIINQLGATGMQGMGKVMGMANQQIAGKADGKTISNIVRDLLAK